MFMSDFHCFKFYFPRTIFFELFHFAINLSPNKKYDYPKHIHEN